jgi:hypothetical protein
MEMVLMKFFKRTISIALLVGVNSLTPTGLLPAEALALAQSASAALSMTTATSSVVAGLDPSASLTSPYATSPSVSTCTISTTASLKAKAPTSSITLTSVANLYVGTELNAMAGISAGTLITAINNGSKTITISPGVSIDIAKDDAITFKGCYQSFFSVNNKGSIQVNSFGISQTVTTASPNSMTLQSCSTTWTEATGLCPLGTITNIVTTTSGPSSVIQVANVLVASSGTTRLRAYTNVGGKSSTLSITIAANLNYRPGITTNS